MKIYELLLYPEMLFQRRHFRCYEIDGGDCFHCSKLATNSDFSQRLKMLMETPNNSSSDQIQDRIQALHSQILAKRGILASVGLI